MVSLALAALLLVPQQTPSNIKARQVVEAAIAALGGDHYLQSNYLSGRGHLYAFNSAGQLANPGVEFTVYFRFPDAERLELGKKREDVFLYVGDHGWEITYRGAAPALQKDLEQYRAFASHSLDTILKTWATDPHTLMLDQGLGQFDQTQIESVLFTTAAGDSATVDFDLNTHLPLRVSWRRLDALTGGHYQESVVYGNWARIGAVEEPFSVDRFEGPQRQDQRYYTSLSLAPFPDSVLQPVLGKH